MRGSIGSAGAGRVRRWSRRCCEREGRTRSVSPPEPDPGRRACPADAGLAHTNSPTAQVVVRASCERGVDDARFVLALDDDTTEFHRRHARDPLIGPTVQRLRGMRTRRKATVTHAAVRGSRGSSSRRAGRSRSSDRSSAPAARIRPRVTRWPRYRPHASLRAGSPQAGPPRSRDLRGDSTSRTFAAAPTRSSASVASAESVRGPWASSPCRASAAMTQGSSTTWAS